MHFNVYRTSGDAASIEEEVCKAGCGRAFELVDLSSSRYLRTPAEPWVSLRVATLIQCSSPVRYKCKRFPRNQPVAVISRSLNSRRTVASISLFLPFPLQRRNTHSFDPVRRHQLRPIVFANSTGCDGITDCKRYSLVRLYFAMGLLREGLYIVLLPVRGGSRNSGLKGRVSRRGAVGGMEVFQWASLARWTYDNRTSHSRHQTYPSGPWDSCLTFASS